MPRTQRSVSKSTYQPGILIQNPVIANLHAGEAESPLKQQNVYQKQMQPLAQVGQLNYLDMTGTSDGNKGNPANVVPVKVFHLPINSSKQDHNQVTAVYQQVSTAVVDGSAAQHPPNTAVAQNLTSSVGGPKKTLPPQTV